MCSLKAMKLSLKGDTTNPDFILEKFSVASRAVKSGYQIVFPELNSAIPDNQDFIFLVDSTLSHPTRDSEIMLQVKILDKELKPVQNIDSISAN